MEYMGVQYSFQCFCGGSEVASGGDYFGRYGSADNCDMPCSGKQSAACHLSVPPKINVLAREGACLRCLALLTLGF